LQAEEDGWFEGILAIICGIVYCTYLCRFEMRDNLLRVDWGCNGVLVEKKRY